MQSVYLYTLYMYIDIIAGLDHHYIVLKHYNSTVLNHKEPSETLVS